MLRTVVFDLDGTLLYTLEDLANSVNHALRNHGLPERTLGEVVTKPIHFYLLACMIGLFQGGIQALSRSYYTRLIPQEQSAQFFGFFNMLGKFAAIVGPLLVGVVTVLSGSNRLGIISLVVLFIVGGLLLMKVDEHKIPDCMENYRKRTGLTG